VHDEYAAAHQERTARLSAQAKVGAPRDANGTTRGQNGDAEGPDRGGDVIAQGNGQGEGQHADEMHGPDADAHGHRAAQQPDARQTPLDGGDAGGQ